MKTYLPSVRDIPGLKRAPVLIDSDLRGDCIPPALVCLASDVADLEREVERLREANRLLQQRDDYVTGCLV
jgi:hypothetical protein